MRILRNLIVAVLMTLVTTVIFGLGYPLMVTGLAQWLFPAQANGSLIVRDGRLIGSRLLGQPFSAAIYFHSRPSAAGPAGYDATASGGTNLGPTSKALIDAVRDRVTLARKDDPGAPVPVDLVTSSGSGLDPDLSPAAALFQVARVAKARGADAAAVRQLVEAHIEARQLGFLGEPRVNVLELNLALDAQFPVRH
ncbi:MAG TPA: potassium-transporting ATPase subunit KdpC [Vicinamibacterales bacterium]|nr:potassium-transporting ATPase subunit KdpC [Vicinamibacterales bacterium]